MVLLIYRSERRFQMKDFWLLVLIPWYGYNWEKCLFWRFVGRLGAGVKVFGSCDVRGGALAGLSKFAQVRWREREVDYSLDWLVELLTWDEARLSWSARAAWETDLRLASLRQTMHIRAVPDNRQGAGGAGRQGGGCPIYLHYLGCRQDHVFKWTDTSISLFPLS